jgi:hypothetical protein
MSVHLLAVGKRIMCKKSKAITGITWKIYFFEKKFFEVHIYDEERRQSAA